MPQHLETTVLYRKYLGLYKKPMGHALPRQAGLRTVLPPGMGTAPLMAGRGWILVYSNFAG